MVKLPQEISRIQILIFCIFSSPLCLLGNLAVSVYFRLVFSSTPFLNKRFFIFIKLSVLYILNQKSFFYSIRDFCLWIIFSFFSAFIAASTTARFVLLRTYSSLALLYSIILGKSFSVTSFVIFLCKS